MEIFLIAPIACEYQEQSMNDKVYFQKKKEEKTKKKEKPKRERERERESSFLNKLSLM